MYDITKLFDKTQFLILTYFESLDKKVKIHFINYLSSSLKDITDNKFLIKLQYQLLPKSNIKHKPTWNTIYSVSLSLKYNYIYINNLNNNEYYTIKLRVILFDEIYESNTFTIISNKIPDEPSIKNIEMLDKSVLINFSNKLDVDYYEYCVIPYDSNFTQLFFEFKNKVYLSPSTLTLLIDHLTNNNKYKFIIRSVNKSYFSNNLIYTLEPNIIPDTPNIVSILESDEKLCITCDYKKSNINSIDCIIKDTFTKRETLVSHIVDNNKTDTICEFIINELENGIKYEIILLTKNSLGTSKSSNIFFAVPNKLPNKPIISIYPDIDNIICSIKEPINYSILGYEYILTKDKISVEETSNNMIWKSIPNVSQFTMNKLIAGTIYYLYIRAFNNIGKSVISMTDFIPDKIPDIPDINIMPSNKSIVLINKPKKNINYSEIISYQYYINKKADILNVNEPLDDINWNTFIFDKNNEYIIEDLLNGEIYYIYVRGINKYGKGLMTKPLITVPNCLPPKLGILEVKPLDNAVEIRVYIPIEQTDINIDSYYIHIEPSSTYTSQWINIEPKYKKDNEITFFIDNLKNGCNYYLKIKGHNTVGFGIPTDILTFTPNKLPLIPSVNIIKGNECVNIHIDSVFNYTVDKYEYFYSPNYINPNDTQLWNVSIDNVLHLDNIPYGINYYFAIRAINNIGISPPLVISNIVSDLYTSEPEVIRYMNGALTGHIVFKAPKEIIGSPIQGYEYTLDKQIWYPLNILFTNNDEYISSSLQGIKTGVVNYINIRAINDIGGGKISNSFKLDKCNIKCILQGTQILTSNNQYINVEYLKAGDELKTDIGKTTIISIISTNYSLGDIYEIPQHFYSINCPYKPLLLSTNYAILNNNSWIHTNHNNVLHKFNKDVNIEYTGYLIETTNYNNDHIYANGVLIETSDLTYDYKLATEQDTIYWLCDSNKCNRHIIKGGISVLNYYKADTHSDNPTDNKQKTIINKKLNSFQNNNKLNNLFNQIDETNKIRSSTKQKRINHNTLRNNILFPKPAIHNYKGLPSKNISRTSNSIFPIM